MIDKKMEPYYDILFSIFIGFVLIYILYVLYDSPRVVYLESDDEEHFNGSFRPCNQI